MDELSRRERFSRRWARGWFPWQHTHGERNLVEASPCGRCGVCRIVVVGGGWWPCFDGWVGLLLSG